MNRGVMPFQDEGSAASLRTRLEVDLPGWRSIEVFGPPGSGKSHLCRPLGEVGVLTMCDRRAVRHYAARDLPLLTGLAESVLGKRRLRNFFGAWMRVQSARYWRSASPAARRYREAALKVREAFPLSASVMRRFDNRVFGSAPFIERALSEGNRIVVDEGMLNQLNSVVARSAGEYVDEGRLDLLRECLARYPWEKNALLVDASPETCARRQLARGHVLFTNERPQSAFHAIAEQLVELCVETGWRVARIRNDDAGR